MSAPAPTRACQAQSLRCCALSHPPTPRIAALRVSRRRDGRALSHRAVVRQDVQLLQPGAFRALIGIWITLRLEFRGGPSRETVAGFARLFALKWSCWLASKSKRPRDRRVSMADVKHRRTESHRLGSVSAGALGLSRVE